MRRRRLLLAASALSTLTFCKKSDETQPLPGNPKGTFYDAAAVPPPPPPDVVEEYPANPKGAFYDAGLAPPALDAAAVDAAPPKDAVVAPKDAARKRVPPRPPLNSNPKGSFYDNNLKDPR